MGVAVNVRSMLGGRVRRSGQRCDDLPLANFTSYPKVAACQLYVEDGLQIRQILSSKPEHAAFEPERTEGLQKAPQRLVNPMNKRSKLERSVAQMKEAGLKYSESAGVELKYDSDDEEIDWLKKLDWVDQDEIVKRYVLRCRANLHCRS